jgi:hypothetical protein
LTARPSVPGSTGQGLAFIALLFFVVSFFVARIFTTIYPDTVVVSSGIHFHHFWYGLGMIVVAGWLGIASNKPEYDRAYAVVFGLGLGLVGDETGLLLTLGDYHSELTYEVFVAFLSVAVMITLAVRYWSWVRTEVIELGSGERAAHLGIGVAAMSALPLAFGHLTAGSAILAIGAAIAVVGAWLHRHRLQ